jgi:hypothetical protein
MNANININFNKTNNNNNNDVSNLIETRARMYGSFLMFCETFFPLVTGREFKISKPLGRESHFITIAKELTLVFKMQISSLVVTIPPGSGKSTILCLWVAWCMARYPDSQFLYISYGFELAAKHTEFIRRIMMNPHYIALFGITIRHDMKAKDHFVNNFGGSVKAFGSSGPITGQDAGLPNLDRFTGAVIMDDMHKPDEAHSQNVRLGVIQNYRETVAQRPRGPNVPIIFLGQRLHEDDLPAFLLSGKDERKWKSVVLQAIDIAGNALYPEVNPLEQLLEKKLKNPYVFSSQYQQEPVPAGGALYKEKDFIIMDEEPLFLCTFITVDTAETSKSYNDATVFSFFGLYKLIEAGQQIDQYALHNIDCWELRIEPKDLEAQFRSFYAECMLHKTKPLIAAIEKKSTGVTLCSVLEDMRGLDIREVKRTAASKSKADRYIDMQSIIAAKLISFTYGAKHIRMVIDHMLKITANDSHRHDDICDTFYDAIKIALIDKTLYFGDRQEHQSKVTKKIGNDFNQRLNAVRESRGY